MDVEEGNDCEVDEAGQKVGDQKVQKGIPTEQFGEWWVQNFEKTS